MRKKTVSPGLAPQERQAEASAISSFSWQRLFSSVPVF
jgi:hypothetical protein